MKTHIQRTFAAALLTLVIGAVPASAQQDNYVSPFGPQGGGMAGGITGMPPSIVSPYGGFQGQNFNQQGFGQQGFGQQFNQQGFGNSQNFNQQGQYDQSGQFNPQGQNQGRQNQQQGNGTDRQGNILQGGVTPPGDGSTIPGGTPSPSAAARGSLMPGDVLRGNGRALAGNSFTLDGVTLMLEGLDAPPPGALCSASGQTTWTCGDRARIILSNILATGPVRCIYSRATGPSQGAARCTILADDVSRLAVLDGAAMSNMSEYRAYVSQARSDRRGIWAHGGR